VDFNVPMNEDTGVITDDSRISCQPATIQYLVDHQAKVILCSHLGRPKGAPEDKFRLAPVAIRLAELIKKPVATTRDCVGPEAEAAVKAMKAAIYCCWKICAFTSKKRRTVLIFQSSRQPG